MCIRDRANLVPYDAQEVEADVKLHANENPENLPAPIIERLRDRLREFEFNRYPDPMANGLRDLIAEANGVERGNVLIGNGGDELIYDILAAWGGPGRSLLDCPPTFAMYAIDAQALGMKVVSVPRSADDFTLDREGILAQLATGKVDVVALSYPNNPTGTQSPETTLIDILNATDALVLVDEAYFEFSRETMRPHLERHPNLVILRTFSKAFSLAGLRVGYLLGNEDVICDLAKVRQPYSVDRFSQWVARLVFRERMLFESSISDLVKGREKLIEGLSTLPGVRAYPSQANFVLFRVPAAGVVWRDLLHEHSVLVRDLSRTEMLEDCLRVTVGTDEENERFLEAMESIITRRIGEGGE